MRQNEISNNTDELTRLCVSVRSLVKEGTYEACVEPICKAMERYPHAPQPHNLMGIILEKQGDHVAAMKHFRAAWALDPTYLPANHNLTAYGTFYSGGSCAFDEGDVPPERSGNVKIEYDSRGIGRIVYKTTVEYDEHGIGRVVRR